MGKKHPIEIPEWYLLTIAVHGNMGDGELPDLMATWARRICIELGLSDKLEKLREERRNELKSRLQNVLGDEFVEGVEAMIKEVTDKLVS